MQSRGDPLPLFVLTLLPLPCLRVCHTRFNSRLACAPQPLRKAVCPQVQRPRAAATVLVPARLRLVSELAGGTPPPLLAPAPSRISQAALCSQVNSRAIAAKSTSSGFLHQHRSRAPTPASRATSHLRSMPGNATHGLAGRVRRRVLRRQRGGNPETSLSLTDSFGRLAPDTSVVPPDSNAYVTSARPDFRIHRQNRGARTGMLLSMVLGLVTHWSVSQPRTTHPGRLRPEFPRSVPSFVLCAIVPAARVGRCPHPYAPLACRPLRPPCASTHPTVSPAPDCASSTVHCPLRPRARPNRLRPALFDRVPHPASHARLAPPSSRACAPIAKLRLTAPLARNDSRGIAAKRMAGRGSALEAVSESRTPPTATSRQQLPVADLAGQCRIHDIGTHQVITCPAAAPDCTDFRLLSTGSRSKPARLLQVSAPRCRHQSLPCPTTPTPFSRADSHLTPTPSNTADGIAFEARMATAGGRRPETWLAIAELAAIVPAPHCTDSRIARRLHPACMPSKSAHVQILRTPALCMSRLQDHGKTHLVSKLRTAGVHRRCARLHRLACRLPPRLTPVPTKPAPGLASKSSAAALCSPSQHRSDRRKSDDQRSFRPADAERITGDLERWIDQYRGRGRVKAAKEVHLARSGGLESQVRGL
ncbi:hypothetical protein B0H10DRAFT_2232803 [Mycena sp. CBHHK59/15]|nr:hypothetical protein B0H10DRAFT_2232803 [Mycena sp. CBHHK59/15]